MNVAAGIEHDFLPGDEFLCRGSYFFLLFSSTYTQPKLCRHLPLLWQVWLYASCRRLLSLHFWGKHTKWGLRHGAQLSTMWLKRCRRYRTGYNWEERGNKPGRAGWGGTGSCVFSVTSMGHPQSTTGPASPIQEARRLGLGAGLCRHSLYQGCLEPFPNCCTVQNHPTKPVHCWQQKCAKRLAGL